MKNKFYPIIDLKLCSDCKLCIKDCILQAIDIHTKEIDNNRCSLCTHCIAICPENAISLNGNFSEDLQPLPEKIDLYFENLIKKRKSIRNYKDLEVSDELINKILNLIKFSPTGTNTQQVYITIIKTKKKVKEISDEIMKFFTKLSIFLSPIFLPFLTIFIGNEKVNKLKSYKKYLKRYWDGENILTYDAPLLFIFHCPEDSVTPEQDGVIWSTIALLYAESLGLGTCFNGFLVKGINANKKIKKLLNIPKNHIVYETFTCGYPQFNYKKSVIRENTKFNII